MKAEIISAYKLDDSEIKEIVKSFKFLKDVVVENTIDKKIKAGFIIKYAGKIVDLSISSRLNSLKNLLYETD